MCIAIFLFFYEVLRLLRSSPLMNRPLVFRKAMDLLGMSTPVSDFSGFILNSEFAGLPSTDASLLREMLDRSRADLFLAVSAQDESSVARLCDSMSSASSLDFSEVSAIIDDIRHSLTLSPGSSDEIPLTFSSSGFRFSTLGCMKGEVAVSGCETVERCYVVPENVAGGRGRYRVTAVAPNAFSGFGQLRSVVLPGSIREIGYRAFCGCSSLDDFILPKSVRRIGFRAFEGCTSLASIAVHPANPFFRTFPGGVLCSLNPFEVIRAPYAISGSFSVPEGVTRIGSESFEGCSDLEEVIIPDGVKSVMYRAFQGCSSLSRVRIPDSSIIGFHAFPDSASVEVRPAGPISDDVVEERAELLPVQHGPGRYLVRRPPDVPHPSRYGLGEGLGRGLAQVPCHVHVPLVEPEVHHHAAQLLQAPCQILPADHLEKPVEPLPPVHLVSSSPKPGTFRPMRPGLSSQAVRRIFSSAPS